MGWDTALWSSREKVDTRVNWLVGPGQALYGSLRGWTYVNHFRRGKKGFPVVYKPDMRKQAALETGALEPVLHSDAWPLASLPPDASGLLVSQLMINAAD